MNKICLICLSLILVVSSCGNKSGSRKFIGFWDNIKSINSRPSSEGPNYYDLLIIGKIDEYNFVLLSNRNKTKFTYNKEKDRLELKEGENLVNIIFDNKTGHIIVGENEYKKTSHYTKDGGVAGGIDEDNESTLVDQALKEN